MTEQLYLADQELRTFTATVTGVEPADEGDGGRVLLDRTTFYATGGGQPHDTGTLTIDGADQEVTDVRKQGVDIWHSIGGPLPEVGTEVTGEVDWERRHQLMRTHSAMHVLGGVIWNEYRVLSTGNNMEPLKGRIDYEFDPLPEGFAEKIETAVNAEIAADRPIEVTFLPRETAVEDEDLIRTKVNMIPESVAEIRVVDIVGLDKQADGGTHVRSTGEIGTFTVVKTESKGKGNKRIRWELA
ncbi:MAG: alanyl-tRNA editing protein [Acidimicrobiales bacterium]